MPIIKANVGGKEVTSIILGTGDVQTMNIIQLEPNTGLPDLEASALSFIEMEPPAGFEEGKGYQLDPKTAPMPSILMHFASLETLDYHIMVLTTFRKMYLDRLAAASQKAAKA